VQNSAVHHDCPRPQFDAVRARVQIGALIEIYTVPQPNMACEPQSDSALNGNPAIHAQYQPIKEAAHPEADESGYPTYSQKERLLENVSPEVGRLAVKIKAQTLKQWNYSKP